MNSPSAAPEATIRATRSHARSPSVWTLTTAILILGATGWIFLISATKPVAEQPWPWWAFVSLFVVGKHLRVELATTGTQSMSFVMTDAAFVVALLLAEPFSMPLALVAAAASSGLYLRSPWVKLVFNLGQELAGAALGLTIFTLLRDDQLVSARTGYAALLGGLAVGLFSHQAVAAITRLASGAAEQARFRSLFLSTIGSIAHGAVAVQVVYLGSISPLLSIIPALVLVVLYLGYRGIRDQQHTTDRTELLYRATAALHEQPNMDEGLLSVLEAVRQALRAESARIVILTPDGAVTCAASDTSVGPNTPMTAAPASQEAAARRLAADLPGAVLLRSGTPAVTAGPVSIFASEDAIVAPLVRGVDPAGVVLVIGRAGIADQLSQSDVDLVEVLAKQIGLALERGFLERSLQQLIQLEQDLTRQAYFDGVTGLANRNYLNGELERLLTLPPGQQHAVLLLDLDDFKTVNDSLGHVAGDRLLAVVAQRLVACIAGNGLVTRIGGDEFAVVMLNIEEGTVISAADRMIESVSQLVQLDGREVGVGASIGIRLTEGVPDLATDLLRDADLALYNAKAQGKGRYARYESAMHIEVQERLVLTTALANAVERDEFTLVFQPIYDLTSRTLAGAEALVRWRHPERGEIGPAHFLALTEESGLIVVLGQHILRQALSALTDWLPLIGSDAFYLSVNVSARQLKEPQFAESVLSLLSEYGVPPIRLVLEITESVFIEDVEQTRKVLEEITSTGVRISLDDFGTGYSSLSQLQHLPIHQLKIDQSFVRRLAPGGDGRVVVSAIVQLADAMHLEAIAEGIETHAQFEELITLGCRRGQGWLLSRPKSKEIIRELVVDRKRPVAIGF